MDNFLLILAAAFFTSYGWGMRGAMIGGEQGALLPGALLGLVLARFGGVPLYAENYIFFAAAGALMMSCGGTEPYAQTMEFVLYREERPDYVPLLRKSYGGIFLKGALWFGVCGAGLGLMASATAGIYPMGILAVLLAIAPLLQFLGVRIFNQPYAPAQKKFPRLYFSVNSREEWGGNLALLLAILLFAAFYRDCITLIFGTAGILFGGCGFTTGLWLYDHTAKKNRKGKYFFGKAQTKGYIDNWKLMEFTFGAIGGGGIAAAWCLCKNRLLAAADTAAGSGFFSGDQATLEYCTYAIAALAVIACTVSIALDVKKKKFKYNWSELIFRPFISVYPLILVLAGSSKVAYLSAVGLLVYVVWLHNFFDAFGKSFMKTPLRAFVTLLAIAVYLQIFLFGKVPMLEILLIYTVLYIGIQLLAVFTENRKLAEFQPRKTLYTARNALTVYAVFTLQSIVLFFAMR